MEKAQGMPFVMIFALIIGGFILFMAIFFSGKLVNTETSLTQAELARNLDILLNPFASIGKADVTLSKPIMLGDEADVSFDCDASENSQTIYVKLGRAESDFPYIIKNKYIFSEDFNTKNLWVFAKPFKMPWRVDDLIYVISKDYCFINPPAKIKQEFIDLNITKVSAVKNSAECKKDSITVCFQKNCVGKLLVSNESYYVRTANGTLLYYLDDATMYAAIFGPSQYQCNLERLLGRLGNQASILAGKADLLAGMGCLEIAGIRQEIKGLEAAAANKDYGSIRDYSSRIDNKNLISCPIY